MESRREQPPNTPVNVRQLKNFFFSELGLSQNSITKWSEEEIEFWQKLNTLGARQLKKIPDDKDLPHDIDEAETLSEAELRELMGELATLKQKRTNAN